MTATGLAGLRIGDLESRLPLVQGGMGVAISLSGPAAAVANEGGVGVISAALIGISEPDFKTNFLEANIRALRREIRKARAMTDGACQYNGSALQLSDMVTTAIEEGIDIIFCGAGLPSDPRLSQGDRQDQTGSDRFLCPITADHMCEMASIQAMLCGLPLKT